MPKVRIHRDQHNKTWSGIVINTDELRMAAAIHTEKESYLWLVWSNGDSEKLECDDPDMLLGLVEV